MAAISNALAEINRGRIVVSSAEKKVHLKKDGTPKKPSGTKKTGVSSKVFPFKRKEDIAAMNDEFDIAIRRAEEDLHYDPFVARRNKLLFNIGINCGLRISDLIKLKYSFFLYKDEDGFVFKEIDYFKPQKTAKTGKFAPLGINKSVEAHLMDFMSHFPLQKEEDLDKFIFSDTESGKKHVTSNDLYKMLKATADRANIDVNVGTHSLRQTFGYHHYTLSEDKSAALVQLQGIFRHTSSLITMAYIGIAEEENIKFFNSINLGMDAVGTA